MGGGWCYDYGGVDLRKESAWIRIQWSSESPTELIRRSSTSPTKSSTGMDFNMRK